MRDKRQVEKGDRDSERERAEEKKALLREGEGCQEQQARSGSFMEEPQTLFGI